LFNDRLTEAAWRADHRPNAYGIVCGILIGFKAANDSHGQHGDWLDGVATRLVRLRATHCGPVWRVTSLWCCWLSVEQAQGALVVAEKAALKRPLRAWFDSGASLRQLQVWQLFLSTATAVAGLCPEAQTACTNRGLCRYRHGRKLSRARGTPFQVLQL
jgi:hypothetical protein